MFTRQNTYESKTLLCSNLLDFPVRKKWIINYLFYHRAMITGIIFQWNMPKKM